MIANSLTAERLRLLLTYDPNTGIFTRLVSVSSVKAGDVAGAKHNKGYWTICVDGRQYLSHRLAWLWVHGVFPADQLDHRNGQRGDNRLCNLREATRAENQQNLRKPTANNKSGFLGVRWHAGNKKWQAQIKLSGKQHHLGYFPTPEIAHQAYLVAKRQMHPMGTL